MYRIILSCLFTVLFRILAPAQETQLHPGDIAIIAFQSDNNDQFAFLCLVDLAPATQIQFSEKGWNASIPTPAFVMTTEGVHTWTAPITGVNRGTVVVISFNSLGTAPSATVGTVQSSAAAKLSTAGDEIIAFQGTATDPQFIYAFGSRPWISSGIPSSNQSWLPYPLINGITARDFATENDNQYFKLTDFIGSKDSMLACIGNTKNWTRSNTRFSSLPNWQLQILKSYYLKLQANPLALGSWGLEFDGSGDSPRSFTQSGNLFHLQNLIDTISLTDDWSLDKLMLHNNCYLKINGHQLSIQNLVDSSKGYLMGTDNSSLIIQGKSGPLRFDNNHAILNKLHILKYASASLSSKLIVASNQHIGTIIMDDSSLLNTNGYLILEASQIGSSTVSFVGKEARLIGKVEVQKYIPSGKRNFRFLSHPFANPIALTQLTSDIDITGRDGAVNGFTTTITNNPSAFWYNPILGDSITTELGWTAFTQTNGLGDNAWLPRQGIRINLRGQKGEGLNGKPYTPSPIVLHLKDSLNTGDQIVLLKRTAINSGYNLIGNPFASEIDMSKLQIGQNIIPYYYLWDPYLGNKGAYTCYPFSNTINLPSFSAFFAQTSDSSMGNTILFPETCKVSNSKLLKVLGTKDNISNQLEITIESDSVLWDRALFIFKNNATDSLDLWDAKKLMNPDISLFSRSAEKIKLCIDSRSDKHQTIIPVGLQSNIANTFQLKIIQLPLLPGFEFYLIDKFAGTKTILKAGTQYSFQIEHPNATSDNNRFEIQMLGNTIAMHSADVPKLSCDAYPNPTGNKLRLHILTSKALPIFISIKNLLGQTLFFHQLAGSQELQPIISMENWASGIYILKVSNKEESIIKKIIKH